MAVSRFLFPAIALALGVCSSWYGASAQTPSPLTIEIEDHVAMPITGKLEGAQTPNESALSRVNAIREETGGSHRWFLPVVSGPIYVYDKKTKEFATYLDFNGHGDNRGLFKKFFTLSGFGNGINGFNLDPDYTNNGKFYTTHMEDPSIEASGDSAEHDVPAAEHNRVHRHSADHDAWTGDASGHLDRMDRHRSVEQHVRGDRA